MTSLPAVHIFCAPKAGNTDEEYEDAGCMASELARAGEVSRYAVADGATETSFAGMWARSLVMAYCQGLFTENVLESSLNKLRQDWYENVSQLSLPWFAEDKANQGAFATFCGLTLTIDSGAKSCNWQTKAIGDSCFMQIRAGKIVQSFPLKSSKSFGNSPEMLCSLSAGIDKSKFLEAHGKGLAGDTFLLMTDALACALLAQVESGTPASSLIAPFHSERSFRKYLDLARSTIDQNGDTRIKNDDVTLLMIEI